MDTQKEDMQVTGLVKDDLQEKDKERQYEMAILNKPLED